MKLDIPLVFHVSEGDLHDWKSKKRLEILHRIAEFCISRGIVYSIAEREPWMTQRSKAQFNGSINLVIDGCVNGEGWLNAGIAYLPGFWHLDPIGILADRSSSDAKFNPRDVDGEDATAFFRNLRRTFVSKRVSRYNQPREIDTTIPKDSIAVFLQGNLPFKMGQCDLPAHELILAACRGAGGRSVVVKPHPLAVKSCAFSIARAADEGGDFQLYQGNVHDLLAVCAVTVSANSAVAIEGFLHRKPAILFGRSDFNQLVTQVSSAQDFATAFERSISRDWKFHKMIYWYFKNYTLEINSQEFELRLADILEGASVRGT